MSQCVVPTAAEHKGRGDGAGTGSPQIWSVIQECPPLFPPSQSSLEELQLLLSSETGKQKWFFFFKISFCHRGIGLKESTLE